MYHWGQINRDVTLVVADKKSCNSGYSGSSLLQNGKNRDNNLQPHEIKEFIDLVSILCFPVAKTIECNVHTSKYLIQVNT